MKRIMILSAAAAIALTSSKCVSSEGPSITEGSETGYALHFFRNAVDASSPDENIFLSPYSAGVALSMLAAGAEGETGAEIASALNGVAFNGRLAESDSLDIRSANAAWIRDGFGVKDSYLGRISSEYGAKAANLDFADPASVGIINRWCSDNTAGRIDGIIDNISPDMVMFLMNALYFKAPWEKAFNEGATSESVFKGFSGDSRVPFMYKKDIFSYAELDGNQLIELPYAGGRYSMLVMLPAAGLSPDDVIRNLNEDSYRAALDTLSEKEVMLRLPKFRLETTAVLNDVLYSMGVRKVFTSSAELGGISDSRIAVSEVRQKCFVEVNEAGSEAAAVTSIGVRLTSVSVKPRYAVMTVDRPFVFAITDREGGRILFAGRVMTL